MRGHRPLIRCAVLLWSALAASAASAERIKDLASIAGVRSNQLIGYGLVVGLNGTGNQTSQTPFTVQSLKNMLARLGVSLPLNTSLQLKNIAAVSVQAELPPFAKPGQTIDITVSSLGNAKSLRGGSLLLTPLKGADGKVYAMAQGNVVVGGLGVEGPGGSSVVINVPSSGRIPNGATVEQAVSTPFHSSDVLFLNLHEPDFTTAQRVTDAINLTLGPRIAEPVDASTIKVSMPSAAARRVGFISIIENLTLEPGTAPARVVINSRTGTIVMGQHVRVMPAAVAHGSLSVTISSELQVSQPPPLSEGQTVVVPRSDIEVHEQGGHMFLFQPGVALDEIVQAINQVGAAPGDLVAILEALKEAGALRAELIVI
jgi:flagellar P-ring protein precursor FlgI